jgi:hypothetical protein
MERDGMANRDVSQLLLQVDANVAVAQRNLQQLSRVVAQESGKMDVSLGKVADAHGRMTLAGNNSRIALMEVQHVARGAADQFAAGTPLVQIFSQHVAQLGQAAGYAGSSLGKFGAFLGGPWGIALTLATVILTKLTLGHKDAGKSVEDLVEKMRDEAGQASDNAKATEIWRHTLQGAIADVKKLTEELDNQNRSLDENTKKKQDQLRSDIASIQAGRDNRAKQLAQAQQDLSGLRSTAIRDPEDPQFLGSQQAIARQMQLVANLRTQVAAADAAIAEAQRGIREAGFDIAEREAKALSDPLEAIRLRYDKLRDAAKAAARENDGLARSLAQTLASLNTREAKETKAYKDAHSTTNNEQSGRQVSFAEATSIARAAGLQVNSGFRSVAAQSALYNNPAVNRPGNPVAFPGASAHNGANGKWAIDIQITDGVTPRKIRKVFADQGVSLTKVLKEKGHFHVEGSRSEAAHAENEAQAAAEKAQRQEDTFVEARGRLNQELLAAQNKVVSGIDAQAKVAGDLVRADEARRDQAIRNDLAEGKFGDATGKVAQARAAQLEAINHSVALAKIENIELQKEVRQIQSADQDAQQDAKFRTEALEYQDSIATTQLDHRRLQLDILDIVYQEKEAHLKSLKLLAEKNGDLEEANRIQGQINHLPEEKARDTDRVSRGTMDPLAAWARTVPKTAAEINEALHSIEAQGLDNLSSSITDLIMGTKSLGDVFKDISRSIIADILQMTVKMLLLRAVSSIFGGPSLSPGSWQTPSPVSFGAATPLASMPHLAGGGLIGGFGGIDNNVLSINGQPRAMVSANEKLAIIPNASRVHIGGAANDSSPPIIVNQTFAPNFAGNAATREEVQQMGVMAKIGAIQAIREERRRR